MQLALGVCLPLAFVLELGHVCTLSSCSACAGRYSTSLGLADSGGSRSYFLIAVRECLAKKPKERKVYFALQFEFMVLGMS